MPADPLAVRLGRAVRKLRAARGISQEGLAERSGLHRTYVGAVERGERNITVRSLERMAQALDTRASKLLAAAGS